LRFAEVKTSGKFARPYPIKGLRLPQDTTETNPEKRPIGYARVSTVGQSGALCFAAMTVEML